MDDESIVNEALLILIGGDETTRHVISGGMLALLERPDAAGPYAAHPGLLPVAVEELLRWVSPVKNMARTATRDVEVHGRQLHEGDQLMLFYPSANRDEDVFPRRRHLDIRREPNPHLAFGFGTHFCLGASLARLELRVLLAEVLARLPDLAPADPSQLTHRPSNFVSGLESMPVRFAPTRPAHEWTTGGPASRRAAATRGEWSFVAVADVVAATAPDRVMVACGSVRRTFGEVAERTRSLAAFFRARGVGLHAERAELERWESGQDPVALVLHNSTEYIEAMFGAYRARAVPFNVNQHYRPAEVRALLADVGVARSCTTGATAGCSRQRSTEPRAWCSSTSTTVRASSHFRGARPSR